MRPLQWSKRGREADSIERRQRQQEQRRLHDEDRLPPEQLGEDPARSRPTRRRGSRRRPRSAQPGRPLPSQRRAVPARRRRRRRRRLPGRSGGDEHAERRANAHVSEAAAKTTAPAAKTGVARRRATNAAGAPSRRQVERVSAQASVSISTSYCARISGRAIVTTDESARTIPTERPRSAMRVRAGTGWSLALSHTILACRSHLSRTSNVRSPRSRTFPTAASRQRSSSPSPCGARFCSRGGRRRQDRGRQDARPHPRRGADPAPVLRGDRRVTGALRVGLRPAAPLCAGTPGGRGRARQARRGAVRRRLPRRAAAAQGDRSGAGAVLLIDELDRADDEFEAFLLEVLSTSR